MTTEFDLLISELRRKYVELDGDDCEQDRFVAHLRSLTRFRGEPMDYPEDEAPAFPARVTVAYAVCHPECGMREFIVDGSTQECMNCGGVMYRTETAVYRKVD